MIGSVFSRSKALVSIPTTKKEARESKEGGKERKKEGKEKKSKSPGFQSQSDPCQKDGLGHIFNPGSVFICKV